MEVYYRGSGMVGDIESCSLLQDLEATCNTPVGVTQCMGSIQTEIEEPRCSDLLGPFPSVQGFCHQYTRTHLLVTWLLIIAQPQVDQVLAMPMWQGWPQVGHEKLG